MANEQQEFWRHLDGINAGMLGTRATLRLVPMSHHTDPDEGALWFITARGTDLVNELEAGPADALHVIGDDSGTVWARIEGRLQISDDRAKLDDIWSEVASAWFDEDENDPDIRLLRFTLLRAEMWITPGDLGFLYQIAKASLTGAEPDAGRHLQVSF